MADTIGNGVINQDRAGDDTAHRPLGGRRVVVVGGTSGMGLGAVRAAAEAGARVVVAGRRAVDVRHLVPPEAGQLTHAVVDITDEAAVRALFEEIGALDHLFITAAPPAGCTGAFLDQDVAEHRSTDYKPLYDGHRARGQRRRDARITRSVAVSGGETLVSLDLSRSAARRYGHRRLFLIRLALFTLASLACGVATTQGFLVAARAVQGVGGAVVAAVLGAVLLRVPTAAGARNVESAAL